MPSRCCVFVSLRQRSPEVPHKRCEGGTTCSPDTPCTTLSVSGVALVAVAVVNVHGLGTHLARVDCLVGLARFDPQLGLVELLAHALDAAGYVVAVVGLTLQFFSEGDKLEGRAVDTLLAGAVLWLLGSMLSSFESSFAACSSSSQPFSTAVISPPCQARARDGLARAFNVRKVFVMHQSDTPRLEKLPVSAQERLAQDREGRVPVVCRSAASSTELRVR
ncbi:hypothetical protein ZWY2020_007911 [Hordeum vulgare]|nr:hypothetical protein ZWY2020_007911 [Hordeum vulgare]